MNYLALIWADGRPSQDDLTVMQRELPAFGEEMDRRGVRVLGRELELPQQAATVRVRDGETLVADGPFAETKEFVAGFDVLECTAEEAIEFATRCPISQFQPIEIRPFADGLRLPERAHAFGRAEDAGAIPYLLSPWVDVEAPRDPALADAVKGWRHDLGARGSHVFGHPLRGPDAARTVRIKDGETCITTGPFTCIPEVMAEVAIVSCPDRDEAIGIAATHPMARQHAVEVRPFYTG